MSFIDKIKAKAKSSKKVIVLPESEDMRTLEALQTWFFLEKKRKF